MTNKADIHTAIEDTARTAQICRALASETALLVMQRLVEQPASLSDLAAQLELPLSTLSGHVARLEEAGLISVTPLPGSRGKQKRCAPIASSVLVNIINHAPATQRTGCIYRQEMPVGNYFDYSVTAPCGIASAESFLAPDDDPSGFAAAKRTQAQILWLSCGFLEYRFPAREVKAQLTSVSRIEFALEICSETYGFNENWRSDVSVLINGRDIGIIECLGDHGGRRGRLNPGWWPDYATQYGELHHVVITKEGCFIDSRFTSSETLLSLLDESSEVLRFTLKADSNARFAGGLNLFGEQFGDYAHGILLQAFGV